MRKSAKQQKHTHAAEFALRGRRSRESAPNSLQFFARIEGELEDDRAHLRGANGIRWRVA